MTASEGRAADAPVLRVHASSRLAFAGTTLALVTLASLATATLVAQSTSDAPGRVAPERRALPPLSTGGGDAVVVDRAPGTWVPVPVPAVVAALAGGAGSDRLPTTFVPAAGFDRAGLLGGTPGTTAAVPVTAPVAAPLDSGTPSTRLQPKALAAPTTLHRRPHAAHVARVVARPAVKRPASRRHVTRAEHPSHPRHPVHPVHHARGRGYQHWFTSARFWE